MKNNKNNLALKLKKLLFDFAGFSSTVIQWILRAKLLDMKTLSYNRCQLFLAIQQKCDNIHKIHLADV